MKLWQANNLPVKRGRLVDILIWMPMVVPISQLPSGLKEMKVVANIAVRNAITEPELYDGLRVRVLDATGDPTVSSGWAEYSYDVANTTWIKTGEKESIDVVLDFANVQNVPQVLKDLSDSDGKLTYKGSAIYKDIRAVKFVGGDAELIYDWSGVIKTVKVNNAEVRAEDVEFVVEFQAKSDYTNQLNIWHNVGTYILPAGQTYKEFAIASGGKAIAAGDVIRATLVGDDTGLVFTTVIENN
jgi:hypothetical protein